MTLKETLETMREQARESTGCLQEGFFFLVYFYYYPTSGDRRPIQVSEIKGVPFDHAGGTSIHLVLRHDVLREALVAPVSIREVQDAASAFFHQILPLTLMSWSAEEREALRRS
jgi:hypothetical protein